MPFEQAGDPSRDDIIVIEDSTMVTRDPDGSARPGFRFVDGQTVRAHPVIIDVLLSWDEAEPLWTMEALLGVLEGDDPESRR